MKIDQIEVRREDMALARPYTIAFNTFTEVSNVVVEIHTDSGVVGVGAGSPAPLITGESPEDSLAALEESAKDLRGVTIDLAELTNRVQEGYLAAPAARAALDMALYDAVALEAKVSVVDLIGRCHCALPTSITIGIKDTVAEVLAEASEYFARGFTVLKVKLGRSVADDIELLGTLRDHAGPRVAIRVDPNQGYTIAELSRFFSETAALAIEFVEQPLGYDRDDDLLSLSEDDRRRVAADESLHSPADAQRLAGPPLLTGIFNIKLMKCGGITPALSIADVADASGTELMWGCMDESVVSIAAALHAALGSPATRYLDLDGSLDLERDFATGGFDLANGVMRTLNKPGLGINVL
jgi:L-alanine-DL-glutamate epimerase-like enolase superfamily enzyme